MTIAIIQSILCRFRQNNPFICEINSHEAVRHNMERSYVYLTSLSPITCQTTRNIVIRILKFSQNTEHAHHPSHEIPHAAPYRFPVAVALSLTPGTIDLFSISVIFVLSGIIYNWSCRVWELWNSNNNNICTLYAFLKFRVSAHLFSLHFIGPQ